MAKRYKINKNTGRTVKPKSKPKPKVDPLKGYKNYKPGVSDALDKIVKRVRKDMDTLHKGLGGK